MLDANSMPVIEALGLVKVGSVTIILFSDARNGSQGCVHILSLALGFPDRVLPVL